jgi:hypothetical protein
MGIFLVLQGSRLLHLLLLRVNIRLASGVRTFLLTLKKLIRMPKHGIYKTKQRKVARRLMYT